MPGRTISSMRMTIGSGRVGWVAMKRTTPSGGDGDVRLHGSEGIDVRREFRLL